MSADNRAQLVSLLDGFRDHVRNILRQYLPRPGSNWRSTRILHFAGFFDCIGINKQVKLEIK